MVSQRESESAQSPKRITPPTIIIGKMVVKTLPGGIKFTYPQFCPRCNGVVIPEGDHYGLYATCLICGYVYEPSVSKLLEDEEENGQKQRRRQPTHDKIEL